MAKKVEDEVKAGSNTIDPTRLQKEINNIEEAIDAKESHRMRYVESCKPFNERISNAYQMAKETCGVPMKVLKAKVRERDLQRKIDGIADDFEADDRELFDQVTQALGGYSDTPLGKSATGAAAKGERRPSMNDAPKAEAGVDSEAFKAGYAARQANAKDAIPAEFKGDDRDRWHNGYLAADRDAAKAAKDNAERLSSGISQLPH